MRLSVVRIHLVLTFCTFAHLGVSQIHTTTSIAPVFEDTSYTNGKWEVLSKVLSEKRIVGIGEFTHGAEEIAHAQLDLIRYLHKEHGFDVILFESGLGEVHFADIARDTVTAATMVRQLMGPWMNPSHEAIMEYVKKNGIRIGGFDVQRTGSGFSRLTNISAYHELERAYGTIDRALRPGANDSIISAAQSLSGDFRFAAEHEPDSFKKQTLLNRAAYLDYKSRFARTNNWREDRFHQRDSLMASNLLWLLRQFPEKKVILIGHNFHLSKYNELEEVAGEYLDPQPYFTIGVFASRGSIANNARKIEELDSISGSFFEPAGAAVPMGYLVYPLKNGPYDKEFPVANTFVNLSSENRLNPARHFDALLILDQVSPARY